MTPKMQAVICDLDGLLFDSERRTRRAWQSAMRTFGCELDDEFYATLIGRKIAISENMVAERFAVTVEDFRSVWRLEHQRLIASGPVAPRPGALALIAWLVNNHIPRAIATSSIRSDALHTLGPIAGQFPVIITGDQVVLGKPNPEIFLTAAAALQIAPHACIALEDSEPGIMAVHAAGMRAIMVPDLKQPSDAVRTLAHAIVPSLTEALTVLQSSLHRIEP
jgi:HAD superfamily hydrolase (TIGR01509 family)